MPDRQDEFSRAIGDIARLVGRVVGEIEHEMPTFARAAKDIGAGVARATRDEWPAIRAAARRVAEAARDEVRTR